MSRVKQCSPLIPRPNIVWQDLTDDEIHELRSSSNGTSEDELKIFRSILNTLSNKEKKSPQKREYSHFSQTDLNFFSPKKESQSTLRRSKTTHIETRTMSDDENELYTLYNRCIENRASVLQRSYTSSPPLKRSTSMVYNERVNMINLDDSWNSESNFDSKYGTSKISESTKFELPSVNNSPTSRLSDSILDKSSLWDETSFAEQNETNNSDGIISNLHQIDAKLQGGNISVQPSKFNDTSLNLEKIHDVDNEPKQNPIYHIGEALLEDDIDDNDLLACTEKIVSSQSMSSSDVSIDKKLQETNLITHCVKSNDKLSNAIELKTDNRSEVKKAEINKQLIKTVDKSSNDSVVYISNTIHRKIEENRKIALAKLRRSRTTITNPNTNSLNHQYTANTSALPMDIKQTIEQKRQMALKLLRKKKSHDVTEFKRFNSLHWNY